jgi:hypothetical protein
LGLELIEARHERGGDVFDEDRLEARFRPAEKHDWQQFQ